MKYRVFIIIGALMLPLIVALAITLLAEPIGEKAIPPKAEITATLPANNSVTPPASAPEKELSHVPDTLEHARMLAQKRSDELKELSQGEWEMERLTIMDRSPPKTIEAAIARADWRLNNLLVMTEEDWPAERTRLQNRERAKSILNKNISDAKKAALMRSDIQAAFKRAHERKSAK